MHFPRCFHRPSPETRFEHIDSLFTAQVDGSLIETMLPELLRVAVSIKSGALLPSDILRRLGPDRAIEQDSAQY
jgi:TnpA family transposase